MAKTKKLSGESKFKALSSLLIDVEKIIGAQCYNGNIQNYGPGGYFEGSGRSFRYPISFLRAAGDRKCWKVPDDVDTSELMTGRYKFGANELRIMRGLFRMLEMLEARYDIDFPKLEKDYAKRHRVQKV